MCLDVVDTDECTLSYLLHFPDALCSDVLKPEGGSRVLLYSGSTIPHLLMLACGFVGARCSARFTLKTLTRLHSVVF